MPLVTSGLTRRLSYRTFRCSRGFTLVELLVVIGIIALLISMLSPSLQKSRLQAQKILCLSNMRQTLMGCIMYGSQYKDYPWNIRPGTDRTGINITKNSNTTYNNQSHPYYWPEGHCGVAYWLSYLLDGKFMSTYKAAGCSFDVDAPWNVGEYTKYDLIGMDAPIKDINEIRGYPTFTYRGPAITDDVRMNGYCGGQIAGYGPQANGRAGCNMPHLSTKYRAILLHCSVISRGPYDGSDNYMAPHGGVRSIRNRLVYPMSGGGSVSNHWLDETVGWTDGSAQLAPQPNSNLAWFVNNLGEVTQSENSMVPN